jgi:hypothetical protein
MATQPSVLGAAWSVGTDNFHGSRPSYEPESGIHLLHGRAMSMLCNTVATSNINMLRTSRAQGAKFLRAPMLHLGS